MVTADKNGWHEVLPLISQNKPTWRKQLLNVLENRDVSDWFQKLISLIAFVIAPYHKIPVVTL